jgi:hypothetical protein
MFFVISVNISYVKLLLLIVQRDTSQQNSVKNLFFHTYSTVLSPETMKFTGSQPILS